MYWVLHKILSQEPRNAALMDALHRFDQHYIQVKVVPFVGDIVPDISFPEGEKVICMGSYSMRLLAEKKGWNPGVYDVGWFSQADFMEHLGEHALNSDCWIGKLSEAEAWEDEFFIRPLRDGKEFSGTTMTADYFNEWRRRILALEAQDNGATITGESEIVISTLKDIASEHRYFVIGGEVVTGSLYKSGNVVRYDDLAIDVRGAQKFADMLNQRIKHPYVMDLATVREGGDLVERVIEVNTLNCSGFYHCDMQKIVHALIDYEEE